jgi:signal transduction histidine kinase/CheY-like chemotaxis protein
VTVAAPRRENEDERLAALAALRIDYEVRDAALDGIVYQAKATLNAPIAAVSLVDKCDQWFKARYGLEVKSTERDVSFCDHAVYQDAPFYVEDAQKHPLFQNNPLVTSQPFIAAYAGHPVRDSAGRPLGTLCVIYRVPRVFSSSEKRQLGRLADLVSAYLQVFELKAEAEQRQRELEQLHRGFEEQLALMETMSAAAHVGGWSINKFTQKLFWTPQTFAIHRHPDDQPVLRETALLYYPESVRGKIENHLNACMEQGTPFEIEVPLIDAMRKDRWVRVIGYPLANEGRIEGAYGSLQDITEERSIREEIAEKREEAERFQKARSDFISAVGHELNTPLNGMIGMLETAMFVQDPEEQKEHLEKTFTSAKSLRRLVANILDMVEVTSGQVGFEPTPVDISKVVDCVVQSFAPQAIRRSNPIVSTFDSALPKLVEVDAVKLEQVLGHLISNALTFAVEGDIEVHTQMRYRGGREELWIEVSDQGPGIPEDRWRGIFVPFTKMNRHGAEGSSGAGLGLAICKNLVELMRGEIGIRRNPAGGSTFWLWVPSRHVQSRPETLDREAIEPIGSGRVLVADDNAVNQLVLRSMLTRLGFHVVLANNGEQAVDEATRSRYDLALIDLQMPDLNGIEVTERIRKERGANTPPILIVTADTSEEARRSAKEAGTAGFLGKPVSIERLRSAILATFEKDIARHGT